VCYTPPQMQSSPRIAALLGVAACLSVTSLARADRVAALLPQIKPPPPVELRDRFHEAINRGLTASGTEVLPAAEVRMRLGASDEMLNCSGGGCVARTAQALSVDRVVSSEIGVTGKDYLIKLRMLDPVGRELAKVDEPCDICTVKEADEAMTRAAGKLMAASASRTIEAPPPAMPQTQTQQPPPKVETAPPPPPPAPPPKVETPPPAVPTPAPESTTPPAVTQAREKHFPWRTMAITSLVVGVAGIAAGSALVAIDGQPTCGLPNPKQACPDVYNTMGGGAALLSFGLAGVAASGAMFYLDYRVRHKPHPTVMVIPTRDGAFVSAGGHF
jgi:hypothetical protein